MNKTRDGRFIEERIKIPSRLLKETLEKIRLKNHLTWNELSKKLGLSEQTIRADWINKERTIPKSVFKKLLLIDKDKDFNLIKDKIKTLENPFWGQVKAAEINKKRWEDRVALPKTNSREFAEFYGILLGDGCIYSNLNGFCITGNSITDKSYYAYHLKKLVQNLFGVYPKIGVVPGENTIRCWLYSRKISRFLVENEFPLGKKRLSKTKFPKFLEASKNLLSACIMGLNDTDGSVSSHPNSKIMIQISITIPSLIESCKNGLESLGIKAGSYNKGINLYGREKVKKYFEVVGSSNPKHLFKYAQFLKTGKVPTNQETESFLRRQ
jgi:hypothetical protein